MQQKVIIIGAGFAGVQLAHSLDEKLFEVLLIDKLNHHQFQPLFYQVATSQLEPSSISFPLRYMFKRKPNIQIRMTELLEVHPERKTISTTIGDFNYDVLILALGCRTNFFGNSNLAQHALTLKSTSDAIALRNRILLNFEQYVSATNSEKEALLNLVIVGAGPTGVELAGAFAEIKNHILPRDYPRIDFSTYKIYLIEGSGHSLNTMSDRSKQASETYLLGMGVTFLPNTTVNNYDGENLLLSTGEIIKTKAVIWAAGVIANPVHGLSPEIFTPQRRIIVDRTNRLAGYRDIYALGDLASMITPLYPKGHPQVANVAINQAKLLARNLKHLALGQSTKPYEYRDLGTMATIGKHKAVVDFGHINLRGYLAWFIWMSLHLMLIVRVKNRLVIFINWAWAYVTKDTSLRLILLPHPGRLPVKKSEKT